MGEEYDKMLAKMESEIITLTNGITICIRCFSLLPFLPFSQIF